MHEGHGVAGDWSAPSGFVELDLGGDGGIVELLVILT
jgi:hypothetical protein